MKEIQIPNGYFHLWKTYASDQNIEVLFAPEFAEYQAQLIDIFSAPIAKQSSYSLFKQCIEVTQNMLDVPHLCFEMAKYIKAEHFGLVGYMATRSQRISESIDYMMRFSRLVIDGDEIIPMQMSHNGHALILSWPFISDDYILINELNSAFIIEMAHQIVALNQFPLQKMSFAHAPQVPIFHYQKFYGCEVAFHHFQYEFEISLASLDVELDQADPSLIEFLIKQAEEAIASKPQHDSMQQQLHLFIADYLRTKNSAPKVEDVAQYLNISVRTLQRQLKQESSSFKMILDTERMLLCEQLIVKNVSFSNIASQLGYSDQSALSRAYKAFRGMTLLQFKKHKSEK